VGLASAIVGQLIIAAAEVIWPSNRDLGDVLFSVSPILTGAGLVTAGVAIIRAGVWARPSRFLPLTLGLYTILVLIPVMIASGGPPAPLALWTIGAGACCGSCSTPASCASPQRRSERPGNGRDHRSYLTAHPLIGRFGSVWTKIFFGRTVRGIERRSACRCRTWERPPDALVGLGVPSQEEDVHG
jgi:hypothetical protein